MRFEHVRVCWVGFAVCGERCCCAVDLDEVVVHHFQQVIDCVHVVLACWEYVRLWVVVRRDRVARDVVELV